VNPVHPGFPGETPSGGTDDQSPRPSSEAVLIENWRADRDVVLIALRDGQHLAVDVNPGTEGAQPACRCYRCGTLLTADTVKVSRVRPGAGQIRPACEACNGEGR
jgi:hypothetical protein